MRCYGRVGLYSAGLYRLFYLIIVVLLCSQNTDNFDKTLHKQASQSSEALTVALETKSTHNRHT